MQNSVKVHRVEKILLAVGLTLSIIWGIAHLHSDLGSRAAIARFEATETGSSTGNIFLNADPILGSQVDVRLWSNKRIEAYEQSLTQKMEAPLAVLQIPKIKLAVPVFEDTEDLTLNRGVGRIRGTARVGKGGNLGIAGHRDGFFRGLKDVAVGDTLQLSIPGGTEEYEVSQIQIVNPEDTWVLRSTPKATLTLVTCFPFYYMGNAPQRYVVMASMKNSGQRN